MYTVGSKVVHPSRGAGTIVGIRSKTIDERSRTYYVIDTVDESMRLMVPVKQAEDGRLRRVGKETRLRKTLATLRVAPPGDERLADYRVRHKVMREKLKTGRFEEVASAVCVLFCLSSRRSLGMTDRRLFDQGKDFLAGELALASGLELSEAMEEIQDRLAQMLPAEEG